MKTYATIAFILGFIMTVLAFNPSWSQYADTFNEYLLYMCLGAIIMAFMKRLNKYDEVTAVMFIMVGAFSVNSTVKWVEIAHLIFTGLAIVSAYISLIANQTDKMMRLSSYIALGMATVLFLGGYFFSWYAVAVAELIVSVPLLINFYAKHSI
jgi:hypothetical protein